MAWIACTFSTNGIRDPHRQVLRCFEDADLVESEIRALRRDPRVDAVIVTPHWGEVEYRQTVEHGQRTLARRFAEAGATA
ncbi:CapA family protein, partial [Vibrio parahaemolyticus]